MLFPSILQRWNVGDWGGYMIYVSVLLSFPLDLISRALPAVDWYTTYIYLCHLIIFLCVSFCLIQTRNRPGVRNYAGLVLLAVYTVRHMFYIEYTFVSFFMMACGLSLILKAIEVNRKCLVSMAGILGFMMGCFLRYDSCIGIIPFLCALAFVTVLYGPVCRLRLLSLGMCAAFVATCYLVQEPMSRIQLSNGGVYSIIEANDARMKFCDYDDDSGIDKTDRYYAEGCTENDLQLNTIGVYYPERFRDSRHWKRVADIRKDGRNEFALSRLVPLLRDKTTEGSWFRWSLLGCCLMFLPIRRRSLRPVSSDWVVMCALTCLFILGMRGRFNDRAMLSVMLPCVLLWAATLPKIHFGKLGHCVVFLVSVFIFTQHGLKYSRIQNHFSPWGKPTGGEFKTYEPAVDQECSSNPDKLYFAELHFWRDTTLPASSICSEDLRRNMNFFPFDGWMALFPSFMSALKERGIDNPSLILLNENNRFFLRAESEQDLLRMKGKKEGLFNSLHCMFIYMQEKHGITLKLEVEKKLIDGLYVARVVKVEDYYLGILRLL